MIMRNIMNNSLHIFMLYITYTILHLAISCIKHAISPLIYVQNIILQISYTQIKYINMISYLLIYLFTKIEIYISYHSWNARSKTVFIFLLWCFMFILTNPWLSLLQSLEVHLQVKISLLLLIISLSFLSILFSNKKVLYENFPFLYVIMLNISIYFFITSAYMIINLLLTFIHKLHRLYINYDDGEGNSGNPGNSGGPSGSGGNGDPGGKGPDADQILSDKDLKKKRKAEYDKRYRESHKEELAEKQRRYRESHKEELTKKRKIYSESHKEEIAKNKRKYHDVHKHDPEYKQKVRDRFKKWRINHLEKAKERSKKYYEKNKDYIKAYKKKRKE